MSISTRGGALCAPFICLLVLIYQSKVSKVEPAFERWNDPPQDKSGSFVTASGSRDARPKEDTSPWIKGQLMVAPGPGASLAEIAADYGATLLRAPGRSGYGSLYSLDPALTDLLRADPRVASLAPMGRVSGAGKCKLKSQSSHQWHIKKIRSDKVKLKSVASVVVAVLDTGLAYEAAVEDENERRPTSLTEVSFVSPYDFVNGDAEPLDDHQHGTHVASSIAGTCGVKGVAPEVSLMPVKVLDASNEGTELDLVEGILHAVENGADVINMSLSFARGYFPSRALQEALSAAHEAGVVMVAAAGNDGVGQVSWPARSRLVISVSASGLSGSHDDEQVPAYSNIGLGLDLLAPGGDMSQDLDKDGYGDGILAYTIAPGDPTNSDFYFMDGTSQAAAMVSASAAWLLSAGLSADQVAPALRYTASTWDDAWSAGYGLGAGVIDVEAAVKLLDSKHDEIVVPESWHAALMPYLASADDGFVRPMATVGLVDEGGAPVEGATVHVSIDGSDFAWTSCVTASDGTCRASGPSREDEEALSWIFAVESVESGGVAVPKPGGALFISDTLLDAVEALDAEGTLEGALLAFAWEEGEDATLGELRAAWAVPDLAVSPTVAPMAALLTPGALELVATVEAVETDGTGYMSDTLGLKPPKKAAMSVSSASDAIGLSETVFIGLSGSAWRDDEASLAVSATSPLTGGGDATDAIGATALLAMGEAIGSPIDGSALGVRLVDTGFVNAAGYGGPGLLIASGIIAEAPESSEEMLTATGASP